MGALWHSLHRALDLDQVGIMSLIQGLIQAYLLLVLDPAYPYSLQKMGPFSARSVVPAADCLFLFEGGSIFLFLPALSLNPFRLTSNDLIHLGSQVG